MFRYFNTVLVSVVAVLIGQYLLKDDPDRYLNVKLNSTYDYIIVGAGSSGSVIANRLSEDPDVSVLLIEAGGSELDDDNFRIPLAAVMVLHTKADWEYYTVPQKNSMKALNNQQSFWPRGRVLGGTSNLNHMVYIRGSRHDYDQWEKEGCTGWGYRDVLPYFLKLEDIQIPELYNSPYHSRGGPITVSKTVHTALPEYIGRAAEEIGYKTVDVNGEDQTGWSYMTSSIRNGERCSTAKAYLRPVMDRPNLHISINTLAVKILFDGKTAVGVEIIKDNRKQTVYARKEIILSGGAINSPALLMLSGIGPKQHLNEINIPVIADLPVGQNLQDHPMFHVRYTINSTMMISSKTFKEVLPLLQYLLFKSGVYSGCTLEGNIFDQMPGRDSKEPNYPDFQCTLVTTAIDEELVYNGIDYNFNDTVKKLLKSRAGYDDFTHSCVLLHSKSKGSIRLRSTDPFDYPIIDPNYLDSQHDVKVLIAAIRMTQKLMRTTVFQKLDAKLKRTDFPGICDTETFDSDQYWECLIRHFMVTVWHPTSTCRMGASTDPTAVVDPQLRVRGISNLRVADASVMRDLPSGNTNIPSIMIGEKVSDLIRNKDTVSRFRKQIESLGL